MDRTVAQSEDGYGRSRTKAIAGQCHGEASMTQEEGGREGGGVGGREKGRD